MQADEPLDFNSAGPHTKAARKRKSSKKHASSARKLESSEKNGRQDAHVHVQRASATKTKKKRAPATKTQKKGRPTRDYHAAPCKNHQTAKKKRCREESNPCPPSTTARDASLWPISRVDVGATMHPSLYLLGANMEKLPLINHSLVSVILS